MTITRHRENPLIKTEDTAPSRSDLEVAGLFNAGVTYLGDKVILLLRVAEMAVNKNPEVAVVPVYDVRQKKIVLKRFAANSSDIDLFDPRFVKVGHLKYLTSISHLRLAESRDGVKFQIKQDPAIFPNSRYETFGIEDARITRIDDIYYITYVSVSPEGAATCLASTRDFVSFERHGIIFPPDNRNVAIFPEKINGRYYALHRPSAALFSKRQIWISESRDLLSWGNHKVLLGAGGGSWDSSRLGAGAVPFKTERGWLEIYHGVDKTGRYCLGAVLLDGEKPWKVIGRTNKPIMQPQADYECRGFFDNVIFTCGLLYEERTLKIYYGAADRCLCRADISVDAVFEKFIEP